MDNPTFEEEDTDERKLEELDTTGPDIQNRKTPKEDEVLDGPLSKEDTLQIAGSQSTVMPNLLTINEEPYDEPDGGQKKELIDKKSAQKRRISFFHDNIDVGSQDSTEGNVLQRWLQNFYHKRLGIIF